MIKTLKRWPRKFEDRYKVSLRHLFGWNNFPTVLIACLYIVLAALGVFAAKKNVSAILLFSLLPSAFAFGMIVRIAWRAAQYKWQPRHVYNFKENDEVVLIKGSRVSTIESTNVPTQKEWDELIKKDTMFTIHSIITDTEYSHLPRYMYAIWSKVGDTEMLIWNVTDEHIMPYDPIDMLGNF